MSGNNADLAAVSTCFRPILLHGNELKAAISERSGDGRIWKSWKSVLTFQASARLVWTQCCMPHRGIMRCSSATQLFNVNSTVIFIKYYTPDIIFVYSVLTYQLPTICSTRISLSSLALVPHNHHHHHHHHYRFIDPSSCHFLPHCKYSVCCVVEVIHLYLSSWFVFHVLKLPHICLPDMSEPNDCS